MSKFKNLLMHSLAKWLLFAFVLLVVSVVAFGGFALHQLSSLNDTTGEIRTHWLQGTRNLGDAGANLVELRQLAGLHLAAHDSSARLDIEQAMMGEQLAFRNAWASYIPTVNALEEKALYESFLQHLGEYERELPKALALTNSGYREEARQLYRESLDQSYNQALGDFYRLVELKWQNAEATVKEAELAYTASRMGLWVAMAGFVFLLFLTGGVFRHELQGTVLAIQGRFQANWVETESEALLDDLSTIDNPSELARGFMSRLTPLIGGVLGGFYLHLPSTDRYHLIGSYGYRGHKGLVQAFGLGEGHIGTCAAQKSVIEIAELPLDFFHQASDTEHLVPDKLLVAPVSSPDGRVLGVVEIAYIGGLLPQAQPLIEIALVKVGEQMQALCQ